MEINNKQKVACLLALGSAADEEWEKFKEPYSYNSMLEYSIMDKIRHAKLCPVGQEMERFAEGMHGMAERHGKKFWEIIQRSMDAGQKLVTHIENCEVCKWAQK